MLITETSPIRSPDSNVSAAREWIEANTNLDSIAVLQIDDPAKPSTSYADRWLVATSRPYLQLDPYWLAAFSAGVVVPRQATFKLRVLTGSCSIRTSQQAITNYGTSQNPNPATLGPIEAKLHEVGRARGVCV